MKIEEHDKLLLDGYCRIINQYESGNLPSLVTKEQYDQACELLHELEKKYKRRLITIKTK